MTGLILIALGTGGIKPCVSAFGGDQFEDHQVRMYFRFLVMYMFILMPDYYSNLMYVFRQVPYFRVSWIPKEQCR